MARHFCYLAALCVALSLAPSSGSAQPFEEAIHDVGNVGLTVTNAGFVGRAGVRNDPSGDPSFEYPLDSGIEHLFEAGLWVGALRSDGLRTVRTAAITTSGGYSAGATGYEVVQASLFERRSSLPESPSFTPLAISQQDFVAAFVDTATVVPGTLTPTPDPQGQLGMHVESRSYAWSFPFTEYFVILEYEITNISSAAWDSVYVGIWEDMVVRNVITTTEVGGNFFNKGGRGFLGYPIYDVDGTLLDAAPDSQFVSYAWNLGGQEESLNTYGAIAFLGAEWEDPVRGRRFFHPFLQDEYVADGYAAPRVNPRYWLFSNGNDQLARPPDDDERYRRMSTALLLDEPVPGDPRTLRERLAEDGLTSQGNWIGMFSIGPIPRVEPGESITVNFAMVAALKPDAFQDIPSRAIDNDDSRTFLRNNVFWAMRTYAGEDLNYNGSLDAGEDINGNGVLDRYLIPEPPASPSLHVELDRGTASLYWDGSPETSIDPITGRMDFEGYRIYRSDPGDDREGNIFGEADLLAQFDAEGNEIGFNNGFEDIRLAQPVTFPGDPTEYVYRFDATGLLSGWQYGFAVTAFDRGDATAGLPSFESSKTTNAVRVFPGSAPVEGGAGTLPVAVYPNPYRVNAAWDGGSNSSRKLYFSNLPPRCEIRVYTLAGEIVGEMEHDAATNQGDIGWYDALSGDNRVLAGGEHAWDILSQNDLQLAGGLYLFSVKDLDTGEVQTGKFVVIL
ncbi:MAG: hypothetical protein IIC18_03580 [Bacteroidetes bacterium]|nr:hypothetical protein [Bacteroidota bacterium]